MKGQRNLNSACIVSQLTDNMWGLIPCQTKMLHTSPQAKYMIFPPDNPTSTKMSTIFTRMPPWTTNTQLVFFFYILMWWELKGFDVSISINCSGNIQLRAVWRHKNRIADMGVWNYKEILRRRDIKQAFSDPSQRAWYNKLRKSSRRCCAFCMSAFEYTFIMEAKLFDDRLMLTEAYRIWMRPGRKGYLCATSCKLRHFVIYKVKLRWENGLSADSE